MRWLAVLALCLCPVTAVAQDDDRGFLTRLIEDNLSGAGRQVRIEGFQGALSSRASLTSLTIADDQGIWLRLTDVALDWNRTALLSGRVEVNSLTAGEIVLERLPAADPDALPSPEAVPFALPQLPVSVELGAVSATSIRLGEALFGQAMTARLQASATLSGGEGSARLQLDRTDAGGALRLSGSFDNETRRLALELSANEPPGGIATGLLGLPGAPSVALNIAGEGPLEDFEAVVSLATDNQDRLFGSVALQAGVDGARGFRVDLKGDVAPLFLPEYRAFFGSDVALFAEGRQSASGVMDLSALRLNAAALRLEGAARLAADGIPERLDLALDLGGADGAPVVLPVAGGPVRVGAATLRLGFDAAQSVDGWRLSGLLTGLDAPAMQAGRLALEGSGRIARRPGSKRSVGGTLRFDGVGLRPADAALVAVLGDAIRGHARFHWIDGSPLSVSGLSLDGIDYGLAGAMTVTGPATALTLQGDVTARLSDLGRLSGLAGRPLGGSGQVAWQGRLTPLSGAFDGVLSVEGQDLALGISEADGLLQGASRLRLDAARDEAGTEVRALSLSAPALRLDGSGRIRTTGPDLRLALDLPDLSVLGHGWGGSLRADAGLTGAQLSDDLRLVLAGAGRDLRAGVAELDGLLRGETRLDVDVHLLAGRLDLARADLAGADWGIDLRGQLGTAARDLTARVRFDDLARLSPAYGGRLSGDLDYSLALGRETARLVAQGTGLAVGVPEADRLLRGATALTLRGSRQDGAIRIEDLRLDNPQVTARATASQTGAARNLDLTATLADLALLVPGVPGPLTLSGSIVEEAGRITPVLRLQGPGGIGATVSGSAAADLSNVALRTQGSAEAALANAFLGTVVLRGPVRFDLALDGRPSVAALSGQIALAGGRLTLADPPFAFSGLDATVTLDRGRAQVALGMASDAGGRVSVSGPVAITAPYSGDLAVSLDGLVLRDPNLYETRATGRLSVSGPLTGGARVAGRIELGTTELRIPSSGLGGLAAIPDLRHVGESASVRRTRARAGLLAEEDQGAGPKRAYPLDLVIAAPNRVFIRGRGLDAELGGDFRIGGTSAAVVPSGGLELIRGRMDLLGKRFAFTEGRMQMEGTLVPTVRLVATTDTVDGSASVVVDGPADAPSIRFLSQPELPEEEVVARLLFGRGLTTLTPVQAAQLASAVATLTGKGGGGVVDRLRRSFGLDDFDVSTAEGGGAAVRAGKYLSENVYVDLKLDNQGKSEVSINLDLSPSVTVRGRSGGESGAGIGIHFERDY